MDRILWLDALKGFGIIFIMMSHLFFFELPISIGYGFIPLFFLAAGYTYKPRPYVSELISKGKRLLIPYFFYSVVIVVLCFVISLIFNDFDESFKGLKTSLLGVFYGRVCVQWPYSPGQSLLLMYDNQPLWFLPCMFIVYIYMQLYRIIKTKWIYVLAIILIALAVQSAPINFPWGVDVALISFLFMLLAYRYKYWIEKLIVFDFEFKNKHISRLLWCIILAGCIILFQFLANINGPCNMSVRNYGNHGAASIPLFFIICLLYTFIISKFCYIFERTRFIGLMSYIGQHSLRLMCIHMFLAYEIFQRIPGHQLINDKLLPFIYIGLILAINHVIDKCFRCLQNKMSIFRYL